MPWECLFSICETSTCQSSFSLPDWELRGHTVRHGNRGMWSWRAVAGVRYTSPEGREDHSSSIALFDTISEMTDMANTRPIRDGMRPIAPTGKSNRLIVHMPITERTKQTAHLYLMSIFDNEFILGQGSIINYKYSAKIYKCHIEKSTNAIMENL